ncbi:MAG: hypothetical protein IPI91_16825 [Flavobacteriales bacterium]|nr:hypothetical protein [Flavobacteriales bacterium]
MTPRTTIPIPRVVQGCLLLVAGAFMQPIASAQSWTQLGMDIDGEEEWNFSGRAVSISADGSTVAIGASDNDGNGTHAGHVRVYKFVSGNWIQQGADIDGEAAFDESGASVSLSDDGLTLAIGAIYNDGNGSGINTGQVRVYQWDGSAWTQLGADIDGEADDDSAGWSVSLSTDGLTLAIGAPGNSENGTYAGSVRVYEFVAGQWMQLGADIDGEAAGDVSGWSVSLSADGSTVAIGAPQNDGNGDDSGHVRVYEFMAGEWVQLGSDLDGEAVDDAFGGSISLSDDGVTLAIGARFNNGNGSGQAVCACMNFFLGCGHHLVRLLMVKQPLMNPVLQ